MYKFNLINISLKMILEALGRAWCSVLTQILFQNAILEKYQVVAVRLRVMTHHLLMY